MCQFVHNNEWHWECRMEGEGFRQLMKFYTSDITQILPAFCPEVTVPSSHRRGLPWQSPAECFYSLFFPKVHITLWTTFGAKSLWFNSSWFNHYKSWQCAYRYFSNMFKYFLDEEPDLYKEAKISKIEWCT